MNGNKLACYRYLRPMTMAEILKPQLRDEDERLAAAKRRSKMIKRFFTWIGVAVLLSSTGLSSAVLVVTTGPSVLKHLGISPAGGKSTEDAADSAIDGGAFDIADDAPARRNTKANTYSYSSESSSGSASGSSGGGTGTPEPSSIVLLALGGLALGAVAIRKRRK